MEKKKGLIFKVFMTILFAALVFGAYFLIIFWEIPADIGLKQSYLYYGIVCACFLFSLLFIRKDAKKILLTLALAVHVAADYFLILMPSEKNTFIGLCVFCGAQFVYFVYTLFVNKSIGMRILNIATRVALCLVAYFVLPLYFTLGTLELIAVMYIINALITLLTFLFYIKSQWLLFIGFLLFFACDIFVGLTSGGAVILGITGKFLEILATYPLAFYCYVPGIFLIASSSVWERKKEAQF